MGVYLHFQAMPENSRLAARLRTEKPLCVMYCELIHRPAGPYDTAKLPYEELGGLLSEIAGNPVFASRAEVDRVYADLQAELTRAAEESPGLPGRSAYFKLSDFDQHLARSLAAIGSREADTLAHALVMGAGRFAPDGFGTGDVTLHIVPPPLVNAAAALFQQIGDDQFSGWEDEWESFPRMYAEAGARGEAIIIA